jgi:NADPH2:quinone reductase
MRAAWYERNGEAKDVLQVGELPTPEPGPGEVRVRLRASGVNPADVKRRKGNSRTPAPSGRVTPHFDGAGEIDKLGSGVADRRTGQRVWVYEGMWMRSAGTAAEFIVLPAALTEPLDDNASFAEGACFGIPAMTAHRALFADGPVAGKTVLVTGGAGAVGVYALQMARIGGARVIATVSGEEKAKVAREFGADWAVNYRSEDAVQRILELTEGQGVDRIVEVAFGANLPTSLRIIRENGAIASYASDAEPEPKLPFWPLLAKNVTVYPLLVFNMPQAAKRHAQADIARWTRNKALKPYLGPRFPLERIAEAHEAVERGSIGNVVVELG